MGDFKLAAGNVADVFISILLLFGFEMDNYCSFAFIPQPDVEIKFQIPIIQPVSL